MCNLPLSHQLKVSTSSNRLSIGSSELQQKGLEGVKSVEMPSLSRYQSYYNHTLLPSMILRYCTSLKIMASIAPERVDAQPSAYSLANVTIKSLTLNERLLYVADMALQKNQQQGEHEFKISCRGRQRFCASSQIRLSSDTGFQGAEDS